jgi:uncharacterized pyridoxamine 5'-phosphate oxidase family protein
MKQVVDLFHKAGAFHLATIDGDQARVRPFGFIMEFEGKLYFATANSKPVYQQIKKNPKVEFSAMLPDNNWIRLQGRAVFDTGIDAKRHAFEVFPNFKNLYEKPENPAFEVFYLENPTATTYSMTDAPKKIL